jgi:hypothetical protein
MVAVPTTPTNFETATEYVVADISQADFGRKEQLCRV